MALEYSANGGLWTSLSGSFKDSFFLPNLYPKETNLLVLENSIRSILFGVNCRIPLLGVKLNDQKLIPRRKTTTSRTKIKARNYVLMKFRGNIDESKDNQLDMKKNKLIFNVYKTSKFHHQQFLNINPQLKRILSKWLKAIPADINNLLFNGKGEALSAITLNQRMVKIFKDRKISVNQMRHSFMSDKYSDLIKVEKEMSNDLEKMGSSMAQSKIYVKL